MQHQIAQVVTELECARLLVYHAARLVDAKQDIMKEAAMAKLVASGKNLLPFRLKETIRCWNVCYSSKQFTNFLM